MPPLLSIHLAVALFGAAGLFGRLLALPPTSIVLGRVVFASVALGLVLAVRHTRAPTPGRRRWAPGAGVPLGTVRRPGGPGDPGAPDGPDSSRRPRWVPPLLGTLLATHWVTFFHAIQVSSVAVGLLTFATFPVFTALLEPLLPHERFDRRALGAAVATLAGVALVVPTPDLADPVTRGAFWGVISGLTFAALSLVNRHLVRRESAVTLAFHQDLWAALVLLPFAPVLGRLPTPSEWALLALLGVVFTAGAHGLFIHGLKGVTASRAAVITSLEPVYGVALAAIVLGERPGLRTLAGGALVLAASAWVSVRRSD